MISQKARILRLLKRKRYATLPEILDLRIASFTKRISDLREEGYEITNEKTFDKKRKRYISRYYLKKSKRTDKNRYWGV